MDRPFFLHVGNNNFVNAARVLTISSPKSVYIRRALEAAKQGGLLLDFTGALATRCIIVMDSGVLVKCPVRTIDLERRLNSFDNAVKLAP